MKCNVFVYGRTKNKDYRWLQKPASGLNSKFFAKILEDNSNTLKKDQKLFISVSSSELYMLAYIFKDFSSIDERGRPISFVVGITCNKNKGREFNYRLPALLLQHNLITDLIKNDLTQVINNNSFFDIEDFDISEVHYVMNKELISNSEENNATLNNSILEKAHFLNKSTITPNVESNFKITNLNSILSTKDFIDTSSNDKRSSTSIVKEEVKPHNNETNISATKPLNLKINNSSDTIKENQSSSSLMNQLKSFEKINEEVKGDKQTSPIDDFKEIIKLGSAHYLAKLHNEKRQINFLQLNNNLSFKRDDFNKVYQELQNYDKVVNIAYEKILKNN